MVADRPRDIVAPRGNGKLRRIGDPRERRRTELRTFARCGSGARDPVELGRRDVAPPQAFDAGHEAQPVGSHALPQVGEQAIDDRRRRHGAF